MKALNLISFFSVVGLLFAGASLISASARASEIQTAQNLLAKGSFRCSTDGRTNVVRVRISDDSMTVSMAGDDETFEIDESNNYGDGATYTAYDGNSNLTYDFVDYGNGKGTLIFSLEGEDGNAAFADQKDCVKIG